MQSSVKTTGNTVGVSSRKKETIHQCFDTFHSRENKDFFLYLFANTMQNSLTDPIQTDGTCTVSVTGCSARAREHGKRRTGTRRVPADPNV